MKTRLVCLLACAIGCGHPSSPAKPGPSDGVAEQLWEGRMATDGTCVATAHCQDIRRGVACSEGPTGPGVVQAFAVDCQPNAQTWTIAYHSATNSCAITTASCIEQRSCNVEPRAVACPEDVKALAARLEPKAAEPDDDTRAIDNGEVAVRAERNMELGKKALAQHKPDKAKVFFQFVLDRYPDSTFAPEAKAELAKLDAKK